MMRPRFALLPSICAACGETSWLEMGWWVDDTIMGISSGGRWNCKRCGPDALPWSNHPGMHG